MKEFYERFWHDNTGKRFWDFELKWPKLSPFIPREKNIVIVDFGCGNGEIISEMYKINPNARYIGVDVSETAIAAAQERFKEVEFLKIVDGGQIPIKDETADFIFTSEVIEHIYDTKNAFEEVSRILKPNGKILLTTPYHGFIKNLLIVLTSFNKHFNPQGTHIRFFTKKSLFECLTNVGLKPVTHGYYGRFWPIPYSIFVLAKK